MNKITLKDFKDNMNKLLIEFKKGTNNLPYEFQEVQRTEWKKVVNSRGENRIQQWGKTLKETKTEMIVEMETPNSSK